MEERTKPSEKWKSDNPCRVNSRLLPLKVHYFLVYGGLAAVLPFVPIVAKQIGISATALGTVYAITPFLTFLCNPIVGFFVDYFQNIKVFYMFSLFLCFVSYSSILSLPLIFKEEIDTTYIRITRFNESEALLNISKPYGRSCLENVLQNYSECKLVFQNVHNVMYNNETRGLGNMINMTYNMDPIENISQTGEYSQWITFHIKNTFISERDDLRSPLTVQCSPSINHCSIDESHGIFSSYKFWVFSNLLVFAAISISSALSLTSVACFELLGTNTEAYGRQRLFGTIAWGLVCPLSGLFYDHLKRSVIFVIFLMAIFRLLDTILICVIPLPKAHALSNISKDLCISLKTKEIIVFSSGVAFAGFLNAIVYGFEFWFLEDLGATRSLFGLSVLMQCLGEVPFLFFSGWIVRKLGCFICFTCVFVGFLLRLAFYSFLNGPWLVLPIDTLHGITFGLFDATLASFGKEKAPKGTEATILGLFNGIRNGLGYGLGSFFGGIGLDKLGARKTFFFSCVLSLGCVIFFLLASYIFRRKPKSKNIQQISLDMEEIPISS